VQLLPRYEVGDQGLVRRQCHHRPATDQESEGQQKRRRHLARKCQGGQRHANDDEEHLHGHQEPAPVESVGEHAADQSEDQIGQVVGGLHQRDQD